jgi:hypothetical protein
MMAAFIAAGSGLSGTGEDDEGNTAACDVITGKEKLRSTERIKIIPFLITLVFECIELIGDGKLLYFM